ncbi:glycosyltransferase family 2 protein [Candidatus Roizmanbacteria bacterium]|nr:glycosyltransferase family 2 protein [Candidatus Roizmanbacteria bacterium]
MKISVIIPAYNEEHYLSACLESLENQEQKADEIILVDNNSTDETAKIAKNFDIKIVQEKQQGVIYARNKGFDQASFDIIARCDADTIVPTDWVKKILNNFKHFSIDALSGTLIFYDLPLKTTFYVNSYLSIMKFLQKGKETMLGPNMAISRQFWQKIKSNLCQDQNQVHEDTDMAIHIQNEGGILKVDRSLIVQVSARRIKNKPSSFFIEYPWRLVKTLRIHKF